jgi:phosphoadenosine phosphosulfate reductase
MVRAKGMNCFYESLENRKRCCRIRKVEPLRQYLSDFDAYVTGLRRDQAVTRADTPKVQVDYGNHKIVKISPLADWSQDQVWEYVREHNVPVNRLHAEGYPSVGCEPCSRAVASGEDPRAGRWWWEQADTKECGLHVNEEDQGSGI